MPARIQRKRARGWRMPVDAVYVGRPSYWGNPFRVGHTTPADWNESFANIDVRDRAHAVELLRSYLNWRAAQPTGWTNSVGPHYPWEDQIRSVLRGRNLVCWCPENQPCHADLLLVIANPAAGGEAR